MKYFISVVLLIIGSIPASSQKKYVVIDLNKPETNEVVLGKGSVNFPLARIYLYNKWLRVKNETYLITASILPDISTGQIKWDSLSAIPQQYEIVDIDQIAIKSITHYFDNCKKISFDDNYPLKTTEYTVIIKKRNNYLIASSNPCLFEFYKYSIANPFALEDYDYISLYPNGTPYSLADISKIQYYLYSNFKGDIHYLGKVLPYGKANIVYDKEEFSFWITQPPAFDIGWQYFGIEEFKLIPQIGIIAGSFKQYLRGGTGSIVNPKRSHFERNTNLFTAISINGIPFKEFLNNMDKH